MGSFGWNCNECGHPILGFPYAGYNQYMNAVVIFSNGDRMTGEYDGYGRCGAIELLEAPGDWRIVHALCYDGQNYEDLMSEQEAGHDETQAGGYDEHKMEEAFGPPDLDEIEYPRTYACKRCYITWQAKWAGGRCPSGCDLIKDKHGGVWDVAESLFHDDRLAVCKNKGCWRNTLGAFTIRSYDIETRRTCPSPKCGQPLYFPTLLDALGKVLEK